MKRKMLTAFLTAAMITSLTPAMAFAAPEQDGDVQVQEVGDTDTETEADTDAQDGDTEEASVSTTTEKTDAPEETDSVTAKDTGKETEEAPSVQDNFYDFKTVTVSAKTQEELEKALQDESIDDATMLDFQGAVITLTSPLEISDSVMVCNLNLVSGDGVTGNLVTITNGLTLLRDVSIKTAAANASAVHVWGRSELAGQNLLIDHLESAGGAPVIVNNGSVANFEGNLTLRLGENSWYGINVDGGQSRVTLVDTNMYVNYATDTQSAVCCENGGSIYGAYGSPVTQFTAVVTEKDGGEGHPQTAYVEDKNLAQFVAAKSKGQKDISSIDLYHDVTLTAPLILDEELGLNGNGHTISGSESVGAQNVVTVTADKVTLADVTIKTTSKNKSALHIYKAAATLNNVTLDNQETAGGAGMIVNAGTARVNGALNILLGANSWGGINVDTTYGPANVIFENGSKVSVTGGQDKAVIYIDSDNDASQMTITGAEAAGLEKAADGSYVLATEKPAPGDGGQGTGNGQQNQNGNNANAANTNGKNVTKAARTGDSNSLFGGAAALLGSGAVAAAVLRKRRGLAE